MLERLARLGYASKALIYVIVGALAAIAAANAGGRVTDTSGALRVILSQPFGRIVLVVLAIGLCGYAAWRALDAVADPDRRRFTFRGIVVRVGNLVRAIVYGALGFEAFRLVRGLRGSSGEEAEQWAGRVLAWPFGEWLLGIVGLIIAAYGTSEVTRAVRRRVDTELDLTAIPREMRALAVKVSWFGIGARGVIVAVLGVFLVRAAMTQTPAEAQGTRESVIEIAGALPGRWLLAGMAAGLIAYGLDQALRARCRRITPVV
jgi:hypothetical protein